jgi:DNA-binding HxlR family transcriptional regulator
LEEAVKKTLRKETCPVARSLDLIGDRWSMLIVRNAFDGMSRFGDFQRDLGLSKSILATRLHALVANGILQLEPGEDGSAYRRYHLTEKGQGLFHVIVGLRQWGESFLFAPKEDHSVLVERASRRPIRPLELRSHTGKFLAPDDVIVERVEEASRRESLRR